jgi:hypothetical protein
MCAWWTGQPVYGSNPASKFVRENFAYLKALTDLLSLSAVTQADLTKLHAIAASAAQVDQAVNLPAIGDLGTALDTAGTKTFTTVFRPSVVLFLCGVAYNPGISSGSLSFGLDNGTFAHSIYTHQDVPKSLLVFHDTAYSIYCFQTGGSQFSLAKITTISATGFSITVTKSGVYTPYFGIYMALP